MTFNKQLLPHFIRDALRPYSEDFAMSGNNPVTVRLNGELYSTHVSYIHDSGANRSNPDEARIQIPRTLMDQLQREYNMGRKVAFIGFFESGKVFVGWEPQYIFSLQAQTIVSVYARKSQEKRTEEEYAAVHEISSQTLNKNFAIALPANALGFYLENIESFHRLSSESDIQAMIQGHNEILDEKISVTSGTFEVGQQGQKERFSFTRTAFPRDPLFKRQVMEAYNRACCVCGRQLSIVQAAHIIPHSEPGSLDTIANGLALCIEHHRLYDSALLLPSPGGSLVFNDERAEYLRQTKQDRGLNEIEAKRGQKFSVPKLAQNHPSDDYLQRGLEIRLGQ